MKEVTDKLDFIKIKNFCSTKNYANDGEDKSQIGRKHICKIPTWLRAAIQNKQRTFKTQEPN